jgi:hypothetical protein
MNHRGVKSLDQEQISPSPRAGQAHTGSQAGQATIEFVLTLVLLMGFTLFYVQSTLVFAWGNYVHYATFMSARAMLSSAPTEQEQHDRAWRVAQRTLKRSNGKDRFPSISQGFGGNVGEGFSSHGSSIGRHPQFVAGDSDYSWLEGVRYSFRSFLFKLPLGGSSSGSGSPNQLELTSESWLGREPTEAECLDYMRTLPGKAAENLDNGC